MYFAIDPGHGDVGGSLGGDGGAVGMLNEQNCNLDIATKVIAKLNALGHRTINVRPTSASSVGNSLSQRVNAADNAGVDYYVSIHLNASNGQGHGSEVWYYSSSGLALGQPVLNNLIALGFTNRGMKSCTEEHLYVVMNPKAPAILIECCFCDNQGDANIYNAENIANAIVKGLTGQTSSVTTNTNNTGGSVAPTLSASDIKDIQNALNTLKIRDNSGAVLTADGIWGARTTQAITNLQSIMGLTTDGIYGPATQGALVETINKPTCGVSYVQKNATKYIQWQLGLSRDGVFGSGTLAAVKAWQTKVKLTADGVFGPASWSTLLK